VSIATLIAFGVVLVGFGTLGATLLVYQAIQQARRNLAHEQEELADATKSARRKLADERERTREEMANELRNARQLSAADQERARQELEVLSAQIDRARTKVADLQKEAKGFQTRYLKHDLAVTRLCAEIDQALTVFISVLKRTPEVDSELIGQVYFLNDRFVKIRAGLSEARQLVDAGIIGSQPHNWIESGWGGPQGHLSSQWQD
jgi:chromosome segregation ATPase